MSTENEVTLADDTISGIAKLLQVAILTGTDIIDNLRTLKLVNIDGKLHLSPEFVDNFNNNIEKMLTEVVPDSETTETPPTQVQLFDVQE